MASSCLRISRVVEVTNREVDICLIHPSTLLQMLFQVTGTMFKDVTQDETGDRSACFVKGRFSHVGKSLGVPPRAFAIRVLYNRLPNNVHIVLDNEYEQCKILPVACEGVAFQTFSVRIDKVGLNKFTLGVDVGFTLPCRLPDVLCRWPKYMVVRATKQLGSVLSMVGEAS